MRPSLPQRMMQISEESDRLDGLPKTHLVAKDHRHSLIEHVHHPTDALYLMGMQLRNCNKKKLSN